MPANSESVTALFRAEPLSHFCAELLAALGTPEDHARIVGDSLVAANIRGVDSHGIQMLSVYIQPVRAGGVNVTATGRVTKEDGVCLHYFGDNGFGQVVSYRCTAHSIRIADALDASAVVAKQ